ncbi:sphingosine kinase [Achlya hypogyna]|uniref:Sphingosine kinase n=1 Tax=Achlya hypogyna TaxID=1202772 RepID=A0A1V9ZKZ1_ACHHY|nr:sphingosine kinase [Achlya hypogyna]
MLTSSAFVYARHAATVSAETDGLRIAVPGKPKMDTLFRWADVLGASAGDGTAMALTLHLMEKHKNGKRRLRDVELTQSQTSDGIHQQEVDKWLRIVEFFASPLRDTSDALPSIDLIMQTPPKQRKFMVLINPVGGTGKGEKVFEKILPIFTHANIHVERIVTERANHAVEIAEKLDLTAYDCVVVIGGDGFAYEVIQGFMKRSDWADAIQFPFAVVPAGSGNGLAKTMAEAAAELCTPESSTYIAAKGRPLELDLASLRNATHTSFIFLSLSWAFMAEVDIESEKYRYLGSQRFTFAAIAKVMSSKSWSGKFSYLEADEADVPSYWSTDSPRGPRPHVALLPAVGEELPEGWKTIEGAFSLFWAMNVSHAATDAHVAPHAQLNDGHLHVVLMEGKVSKGDYMGALLGLEKGQHIEKPNVKVVKTRAFQLETPEADLLSADGERYGGGVCQVEVHRGMARVMGILK